MKIKGNFKTIQCILILCVLLFCISCEGSSLKNIPDLPEGITEISAEDYGRITTEEGFILNNNPWNKTSSRGDYIQKVFKGVTPEGKHFFGWQWSWETANEYAVLSYPEVFYGSSPWDVGHHPGFPVAIGEHSFRSSFDVSMEIVPRNGRERWNLTYDLWVLDRNCEPGDFKLTDIKCEIMVWLDSCSPILDQWLGGPSDTIRAQGYVFSYYKAIQPDGQGPDGAHEYAAFTSKTPIHKSEDFDLTPFIMYLVNSGVLSRDDYIATIEFGNEIYVGSGVTIIKDYSVKVE